MKYNKTLLPVSILVLVEMVERLLSDWVIGNSSHQTMSALPYENYPVFVSLLDKERDKTKKDPTLYCTVEIQNALNSKGRLAQIRARDRGLYDALIKHPLALFFLLRGGTIKLNMLRQVLLDIKWKLHHIGVSGDPFFWHLAPLIENYRMSPKKFFDLVKSISEETNNEMGEFIGFEFEEVFRFLAFCTRNRDFETFKSFADYFISLVFCRSPKHRSYQRWLDDRTVREEARELMHPAWDNRFVSK